MKNNYLVYALILAFVLKGLTCFGQVEISFSHFYVSNFKAEIEIDEFNNEHETDKQQFEFLIDGVLSESVKFVTFSIGSDSLAMTDYSDVFDISQPGVNQNESYFKVNSSTIHFGSTYLQTEGVMFGRLQFRDDEMNIIEEIITSYGQ